MKMNFFFTSITKRKTRSPCDLGTAILFTLGLTVQYLSIYLALDLGWGVTHSDHILAMTENRNVVMCL